MANLLAAIGGLVGLAVGGPAGAALGAGLGSAASGSSLDWVMKDAGLAFGLGSIPGAYGPAGLMKTSLPQDYVTANLKNTMDNTLMGNVTQGLGIGKPVQDGIPSIKAGLKSVLGGGEGQILGGDEGILGLGIKPKDLLFATALQQGEPKPPPMTAEQQYTARTGERTPYKGVATILPKFQPHRMQLRAQGGFIEGPGSGKSDSIKAGIYQNGGKVQEARLSDGEFVMTADAVKGAGGGNRAQGAAKMYEMMNRYEGMS